VLPLADPAAKWAEMLILEEERIEKALKFIPAKHPPRGLLITKNVVKS
jgi:hypothetical protein